MTERLHLSEPVPFKGTLARDGSRRAVDFQAYVDPSGEVQIVLGRLPYDESTEFIVRGHHNGSQEFARFSLSGVADDGTTFETHDLHFLRVGPNWNTSEGSVLSPEARCSSSSFNRRIPGSHAAATLQMRLKGFRAFKAMTRQTRLGVVSMVGPFDKPDPNTLSGIIALQAPDGAAGSADSQWRTEGEALLEHIRLVMSFACARSLRAPISESWIGDTLKVDCYSQASHTGTQLPVFHHRNLNAVFACAVGSFFERRHEVERVRFAIEWFIMDATHVELRLVNVMTALENLVDTNLLENEKKIQSTSAFRKTSKVLRRVIEDCMSKWEPDARPDAAKEIGDKLGDLNRRSFIEKLRLLAEQWQVPLHDISDQSIRGAKKARDHIVHRGAYDLKNDPDSTKLWDHMIVLRELVARFLLASIGYQGRYQSYIGGYHNAVFPYRDPV